MRNKVIAGLMAGIASATKPDCQFPPDIGFASCTLDNRVMALDTLDMTPREAVIPVVERLRDMDIIRIVVFGSAARGTDVHDSDLDLAIIVPDSANRRQIDRVERALEFRRVLRDINMSVAIDILVYTESEFTKLSVLPSFVRAELVEGGEVVYDRAG